MSSDQGRAAADEVQRVAQTRLASVDAGVAAAAQRIATDYADRQAEVVKVRDEIKEFVLALGEQAATPPGKMLVRRFIADQALRLQQSLVEADAVARSAAADVLQHGVKYTAQ